MADSGSREAPAVPRGPCEVCHFPVAKYYRYRYYKDMSTVLPGNFLNVEEAAVVVGCTPGRIRQMLRSGELSGKKANKRAWVIRKAAAEKLAENRPPKGRPPKD